MDTTLCIRRSRVEGGGEIIEIYGFIGFSVSFFFLSVLIKIVVDGSNPASMSVKWFAVG